MTKSISPIRNTKLPTILNYKVQIKSKISQHKVSENCQIKLYGRNNSENLRKISIFEKENKNPKVYTVHRHLFQDTNKHNK